jgi:hypothetical protein
MADLLDRIQREIGERLDASRAAVEEYERLQAARRALQAGDGERAGRAAGGRRRPRSRPAGGRAGAKTRAAGGAARAGRAARRKRAPRGANREAVLAAVRAHPGVTPSEVASTSGVKPGIVYNELRRLVSEGELVKQTLASGRTGYAPA